VSSSVSESIIHSILKIENNNIDNIQEIEGSFVVTNDSDETIEFSFPSGCQSVFNIYKNGARVFESSKKIVCLRTLTSFELHPNETKSFELFNPFDIFLEHGDYTIKAYLIGYEDQVFAKNYFSVSY
jgi:endoglucanase Acf2